MKKFLEKTITSQKIYNGKIFDVEKDEVELSNGIKSVREVVRHPGGVVVLAVDENDEIILVKQYRYPLKQVMYELPAGKLNSDEDKLEAAQRELLEETGYIARNWQYLGVVHPSPGFLEEILHLFKATELKYEGILPDEDEIIECEKCSRQKIFDMIKNGEINDAKSICAVTRGLLL